MGSMCVCVRCAVKGTPPHFCGESNEHDCAERTGPTRVGADVFVEHKKCQNFCCNSVNGFGVWLVIGWWFVCSVRLVWDWVGGSGDKFLMRVGPSLGTGKFGAEVEGT